MLSRQRIPSDLADYCDWMESHGEVPPLDYGTALMSKGYIIHDNTITNEDDN